ncbi:MAG: hypothetical protein NTX48_14415 [Planctomycetales bacterium]|nr:hypothetical protein [Planctomycetales bacterium]
MFTGESQSAERLRCTGELETYPNLSEIPASGNKVGSFPCGIVGGLDDTSDKTPQGKTRTSGKVREHTFYEWLLRSYETRRFSGSSILLL